MTQIFVNDKILTNDYKTGFVRFIGQVADKHDWYYGIELINDIGKNNGIYKNVRYFKIQSNTNTKSGLFLRYNQIRKVLSTDESFPCAINERVYVKQCKSFGEVVFIGKPQNAKKITLGIKLEKSNGNCNGTYNNSIRYFKTKMNYGYYCTLNDIKSDTVKVAKKIIKKRKEKPVVVSDFKICDTDKSFDKYKMNISLINCGDKIVTDGYVGIIQSIPSMDYSDDIIRIEETWPSNGQKSIELKEISNVITTQHTIQCPLHYKDVIFCKDTNRYAVVKRIEKTTKDTLRIMVYELPTEKIPSYATWKRLRQASNNIFIRRQIDDMNTFKYRNICAWSYSQEIKPILEEYEKQQQEAARLYRIKQQELARIKLENEKKIWYNNEWLYTNNCENIVVGKSNSQNIGSYVIKLATGKGTLRLKNFVPPCDVYKWKIKLEEYGNIALFLGVTQDDSAKKDYDQYCCKKYKKIEYIKEQRWTDDGEDDFGRHWRDGCYYTETVRKETFDYEFKKLYGLCADVKDGFDETFLWEPMTCKYRMKMSDEYIFEVDNINSILKIYINSNKEGYTFNMEKGNKYPIISFESVLQSDSENTIVFSFY